MDGPWAHEVIDINKLLREHFGIADNGDAIFRIVWSETQYEKRLTKYTDEGLELLTPEVRLLPKYKQWIHQKYVLERLVAVPQISAGELAGVKVSYEPLHAFEDKNGNPLPPKFEISKFVIDTIFAAMGQESLGPKYADPEASLEANEARVEKLQEQLFGNETEVGDALAHKQAIIVPRNYNKVTH
jgi:hypothetical protein